MLHISLVTAVLFAALAVVVIVLLLAAAHLSSATYRARVSLCPWRIDIDVSKDRVDGDGAEDLPAAPINRAMYPTSRWSAR